MMTTTEPAIDQDFERYCQQHLPAHLANDTTPDGELARISWRGTTRRWWLTQIANGFRPAELLGDLPMPPINAAGRAVRPPRSEVSTELEMQAHQVGAALGERGLHLDSLAAAALSMAIDTPVARLQWAISEGLAAIARHDAKVQNERAEAAQRRMLTVHLGFRAKTKSYAVGQHPISVQEAQDLGDWASKMEAEAAARGWPAPNGYDRSTWPPYSIG
jgi:hypothetical protein